MSLHMMESKYPRAHYDSDEDDDAASRSSHSHMSGDTRSRDSFGFADQQLYISRSKMCVYLSLALAAFVVTIAAFLFVRGSEIESFQSEFLDLAREIIDIAEQNADNTVGQVRSLSISMASHVSTDSSMDWPNVTLPHFNMRLNEALDLTGAELFAFLPLVPMDHRQRFEAYTAYKWNEDHHEEGEIPTTIHDVQGEYATTVEELPFHAPLWQSAPPARNADILLLDMNTFGWFRQLEVDVLEVKHSIMSRVVNIDYLLEATRLEEQVEWHPRTVILQDIPQSIIEGEDGEEILSEERGGFVVSVMPWELYFKNVLPLDVKGFLVEVNDHCGSVFTYELNGHTAVVRGEGNLHDPQFDHLHQEANFAGFAQYDGQDTLVEHCYYTIDVYPTTVLKDQHFTNTPFYFAGAIFGVFLFTAMVFFFYDLYITRRQRQIAGVAKRTANIVKSLFPKNVQERIMEEVKLTEDDTSRTSLRMSMKDRLKDALSSSSRGTQQDDQLRNMPPIADLFPSVTIMFADLVGFTAWSSMREPAQVFHLLETIYAEFDDIAKKRRIFKVETVGDCYVAACGLPDPRKDHAVSMARFARDCRSRMMSLMTQLEVTLGPDTGELGVRVGLHSGPVTGGVLRGEKARFQLFGDTMNTTARIETTGEKNKIHMSEETAAALEELGKGHWAEKREDKVVAKGKGELTTFWLTLTDKPTVSVAVSDSGESSTRGEDVDKEVIVVEHVTSKQERKDVIALEEKHERLVRWNTEVMCKILQDVLQRRDALDVKPDLEGVRQLEKRVRSGLVIDEVVEIIPLPQFDADAASRQALMPRIELPDEVRDQMQSYIHAIATLYRTNPFHNFEHVSHVLMSVTKLFSRIVAPEISGGYTDKTVHDHTYGITSDPLTQFAAAFSALIHDVDHQGVTNATLIEEQSTIAKVYKNKSVAEQNSVDIAWNLLMDNSFFDLRNAIFSTPNEYRRFRELVVNLVMATDIMDKQLSQLRKARWNKAFSEQSPESAMEMMDINRKATVVLEHVIQASDVAHTMQHWHIYRKWNTRLFREMMKAFKEGRIKTNPADNWYKGEIGFFDFYIIPLAKKLKECGVFGVSSDEYLNYATKNRKEWEIKGHEVVAEMMASL